MLARFKRSAIAAASPEECSVGRSATMKWMSSRSSSFLISEKRFCAASSREELEEST